MTSAHHRRGFRAAIAATGLALVATPLALLPSTAHAADPVDLTLLNINDFHGRINGDTVAFAGTVEKLRREAGEANTLFLSAGDNIGASLFASASADDKPTLDVLNALDLSASAVGNHEFDKGFADLNGRVAEAAEFPYLGANVYKKGTTDPALDEYVVLDAAGLKVGVIGAVTVETPTLVSPGGIADLEFGDPVEAVNRVAAQLSDGNTLNGEADVIVAEYHEGAPAGVPEEATLEGEVAQGGAFADIVKNTSAEVDAIFTGHTHKQYAWDDGSRPIVQTGSYGDNVGKVTLSVDPDTHEVTASTEELVQRLEPADTDSDEDISDAEQKAFDDALVAEYPRVAEVEQIVDAAIAAADEKGSVPVGSVVDDITTAFIDGTYGEDGYEGGERDDRMSESTLGNLVANALRDTLDEDRLGGAEIGVVNPGGLRSELFYAGEEGADANQDGVITYAEANAVLPFVNNLWTVTLTGRQFKQLLEQQWQPAESSRPFLHLGLSDNVSVTLDEDAPAGRHVTSVRVDGTKLRPKQEYRIGTFSFLAQGGDNFTVFEEATNVKDSGLIDRDAWIAYLQDNAGLAASYDRRQVFADDLPRMLDRRRRFQFTLERLNLTSLGSPANKRIVARLEPRSGRGISEVIDRFKVDESGTAQIDLRMPAKIRNRYVVRLVAQPSRTTVVIPVRNRVRPKQTWVTVAPGTIEADETSPRVRIRYADPRGTVRGKVKVRAGGETYVRRLRDERVRFRLEPFANAGQKTIRVRYLGSRRFRPSGSHILVRVVR